ITREEQSVGKAPAVRSTLVLAAMNAAVREAVGAQFRGLLCQSPGGVLLFVLWPVAVDDAASVGRDVDASILVRVDSNHEARVVPVVIAVIDLTPACAAIYRAIEAARGADLSGEVDGGIRLSSRWSTKSD